MPGGRGDLRTGGLHARGIATGVVAAAGVTLGLAVVTSLREARIARAGEALARQDASLQGGVFDPAPPAPGGSGSGLPRADLATALYLARAAPALDGAARAATLDRSAALAARAVAARPHWGEAWLVQAFDAAQRRSPTAPATLRALARSYGDAPYLRHGAEWRVSFGLAHWAALDAVQRNRVIDEGVWLTRIDLSARNRIFALARRSPAFLSFLLRWREFRLRDADYRVQRRAP